MPNIRIRKDGSVFRASLTTKDNTIESIGSTQMEAVANLVFFNRGVFNVDDIIRHDECKEILLDQTVKDYEDYLRDTNNA